jgi:hypothetical protein
MNLVMYVCCEDSVGRKSVGRKMVGLWSSLLDFKNDEFIKI